jgi:hypothetical protein
MAPPRKYRPHWPVSVSQEGQPIGDFANELLEIFEAPGEHGSEDELLCVNYFIYNNAQEILATCKQPVSIDIV